MQPRRFQVEHNRHFTTINAMSPVNAVAAISRATRHGWRESSNGWLEVWTIPAMTIYKVKEA